MKSLFAALLACLCLSAAASAQQLGTGAYAFASFDNRGFDSVNLGNLNVRFTMPIVNRTGRGVPFIYGLQYEGLVWTPSTATGTATWVPDANFGFNGVLNGITLTGYLTHKAGTKSCPPVFNGKQNEPSPPVPYDGNYVYHDAYGGVHAFSYSMTDQCAATDDGNGPIYTGNGSSSDGSGYTLNTSTLNQVSTRSGYVFQPASSSTGQDATSLTDSNGNYISTSGNGSYVDTLGITALTVSGSSPRTFTYPVSHQAGNATTASATLNYQAYTVQTSFGCSNVVEYSAQSVNLPSSLVLADGSTYSFTYEPTSQGSANVTGRLASVTLPTGGMISYKYTGGCSGAGINADGSVGALTRTTTDGTRTYTRAQLNTSTGATSTTVQDEAGNQTYYAFEVDSTTNDFLETHRQVYQGSTTSGTQLLDRYTCYNGASANCDGGSITLPVTSTSVTESYNHGSQSLTQNTYDSNGTLLTDSKISAGSNLQYELQQSFNTLGELTGKTEKNGSGTAFSYSYYNYDEGSVTGTSSIPQHGSAGSTRGNLTSVHTSYGPGYLASSITYYDTGQPATTTGQDGGVTTYQYDSTQGFVTSTVLPTPSSGVNLGTSATFDVNTTAPLTATGMNSDTTTITQYDLRMRPLGATLPSGSNLTMSYSDANDAYASQTLDSSRTATSYSQFDSYGRLSRTAIGTGQSSGQFYQVDYCYNSTGLLQFQSARYQGAGYSVAKQCSGAGTSYTYDALGRVTGTATIDGSGTTAYSNRAVQMTDVNGISRIVQYDVLGRITAICEVSGTNYGNQSTASCGTDLGGTGYLTSYSYSLDGSAYPTTTITQGAQSRVLKTDNAGRTISTSEPERGTTSYSYAFTSGTGLAITRARAKANQTNAGTLTNTVTQYDYLSRPVSVSYDDGLTPGKNFYYDASPTNQGWSSTASNQKGQLAAMTTSNTRAMFSYDVSGNVTSMWQCAPSLCGGSNQQSRPTLQYTYDQSGAVMSAFDGASGTIAYGRSAAGEVTSVTNQSINNSTNPEYLVSNVVNGPFGPTSWALGNGLNGTKSYDALGRITYNFLCSGSSSQACSGGSTLYGNTPEWKGNRPYTVCDSTFGAYCRNATYDDLNRLTSLTSSEGSDTYSYDRYGNRTTMNGVSYSFNASTNQQTGNTYDAAGNQTADSNHSYTYDAEGKILTVDGGNTATYAYDALDHRVSDTVQGTTTEYLFDPFGRRQSSWLASNNFGNSGRIYWDYGLLANRSYNGGTYFHHSNYLGTERMRTNWVGTVTSTYASGPYGEGPANGENGTGNDTNQDPAGYTGQDHDPETGTDHFQYRQYSESSGSWMSPDPYSGSYDFSNPQSLNRYSYVLNNPLSLKDQFGLFAGDECSALQVCIDDPGDGGSGGSGDYYGGGSGGADPCAVDACVSTSAPAPTPDPNPTDPCLLTSCYVYFPGGSTTGAGGGGSVTTAGSGSGVAPNNPKPCSAYSATGTATYYNLPGQKTASGAPFNPNTMNAAMFQPGLVHMGDIMRVSLLTNPAAFVTVTVNDTGPFLRGPNGRAVSPLQSDPNHLIDLTPTAFMQLNGSLTAGHAQVNVSRVCNGG